MTSERKKLYLYAGVNLIIGVIVGIVLFYGQLKSGEELFAQEYSYDTTTDIADVLRAWWLNLIWIIAVLLAHSVVPMAYSHIILGLRGCVSSFSVMYMLKYLGIREVISSVVPQCASILPLLWWFSVTVIEKRRRMGSDERAVFSIKRSQTVLLLLLSLAAAAVEVAFFKILCYALF